MYSTFIHECTIRHYDVASPLSQSDSGEPQERTYTDTVVKCRFISPSGLVYNADSGKHYEKLPSVMLPPTAIIDYGDLVISTSVGFVGSFSVQSIKRGQTVVNLHHITVALKAVT